LISDILTDGPGHDHIALALRLRRGPLDDGRRLLIHVLEHSDPRRIAVEGALGGGDPAHNPAWSDGGAQTLNDEIIQAPVVDRDFPVFVAEHREPDLLHTEAVADQRKHADARPARRRCRWS